MSILTVCVRARVRADVCVCVRGFSFRTRVCEVFLNNCLRMRLPAGKPQQRFAQRGPAEVLRTARPQS